MSLDALADDIAAAAKSEAKALIAAAEAEAAEILAQASTEAQQIETEVMSKAEREAVLLSKELFASAKQGNQKRILIARRVELDRTQDELKELVGSAKLTGRAKLIRKLLGQAQAANEKGMVLRPVAFDRNVIEKEAKGFKLGSDVSGLGGFTLENADGTISLDFRFESELDSAWNDNLGEVRESLFS